MADNVVDLINMIVPKIVKNTSPALMKKDFNSGETFMIFVKDRATVHLIKKSDGNVVVDLLAYQKNSIVIEVLNNKGEVRIETPDKSFLVVKEVEPKIYQQILQDFTSLLKIL